MNNRIILTESEIIWLLEIDGHFSNTEADPDLSKNLRDGLKDEVRNIATQVLHKTMLAKSEQTAPYCFADIGVQVNGWDLYDSYNGQRVQEIGLSPIISLERSLCSNEVAPGWAELLGIQWPKDPHVRRTKDHVAEHMLKHLWILKCPETDRMKVTSIACNPHDQMLIASSYASVSSEGLILIWNIQNITSPEIVLKTSSNPMVAKFCPSRPNLMASGNENGMVYFFDTSTQPVLRSEGSFNDLRHMGSISDISWMGENVISCGYDGRVMMWATPTSFASQNQILLRLQSFHRALELPRPIQAAEMNSSVIPAARSIEIPVETQENLQTGKKFYVGSADGSIHLYTTVQSHVPITTIRRHLGSVTRIRVVKDSDVLASLGEEGSVVIAKPGSSNTLSINTRFTESIVDFACCEVNSNIIAVLRRSSLEIWNISPAPKLVTKRELSELRDANCVTFIPNTTGIVIGDGNGALQIIRWNDSLV